MSNITHPLHALMEAVNQVPSYEEWDKFDREENAKLEAQRVEWYKKHNIGFSTATYRSMFEAEGKQQGVLLADISETPRVNYPDKDKFITAINGNKKHYENLAKGNPNYTFALATAEGEGETPEKSVQDAISKAMDKINKKGNLGFKPQFKDTPASTITKSTKSTYSEGRGRIKEKTTYYSMVIACGRLNYDGRAIEHWDTRLGQTTEQKNADATKQMEQEVEQNKQARTPTVQSLVNDIAQQVGGTPATSKSGYPAIQKEGVFVTFMTKDGVSGTASFANLNTNPVSYEAPYIRYGSVQELATKKDEIVNRINGLYAKVGKRVRSAPNTQEPVAQQPNPAPQNPEAQKAKEELERLEKELRQKTADGLCKEAAELQKETEAAIKNAERWGWTDIAISALFPFSYMAADKSFPTRVAAVIGDAALWRSGGVGLNVLKVGAKGIWAGIKGARAAGGTKLLAPPIRDVHVAPTSRQLPAPAKTPAPARANPNVVDAEVLPSR
jgi:hypothetical protein